MSKPAPPGVPLLSLLPPTPGLERSLDALIEQAEQLLVSDEEEEEQLLRLDAENRPPAAADGNATKSLTVKRKQPALPPAPDAQYSDVLSPMLRQLLREQDERKRTRKQQQPQQQQQQPLPRGAPGATQPHTPWRGGREAAAKPERDKSRVVNCF
jgi:hypothetical protein